MNTSSLQVAKISKEAKGIQNSAMKELYYKIIYFSHFGEKHPLKSSALVLKFKTLNL